MDMCERCTAARGAPRLHTWRSPPEATTKPLEMTAAVEELREVAPARVDVPGGLECYHVLNLTR